MATAHRSGGADASSPRNARLRTTELKTKRQTMTAFAQLGSPRVLVAVVLIALATRIAIGTWGWADLMVIAATVAATGVVEWVIHRFLLHAPEESRRTRYLGTGRSHRRHHLDPPAIEWVVLSWIDAAVFAVLLATFAALWSLPLIAGVSAAAGWQIDGGLVRPWLTAVVAAWVTLAHYEWVHLLVHTAYRPRSRTYARLAKNHRLHHFRNEHYWLGVTSNLGDRVLGTLPADKSDVPLSPTARDLSSTRT